MKKIGKKLATLVCCISAVAGITACGGKEQVDNPADLTPTVSKLETAYNAVYDIYGYNACYKLASDKSCIEYDSNPYDFDDYMATDALAILKKLNSELGLPEYVYKSMTSTTALQGKQTETVGGVKAAWTYHPDNGLEVLYILAN